jgi:transposase
MADLSERQWQLLAPLLPKPKLRRDKRGRPWRDPRDVLNGILWVMRTGAPWHDLPARYPSYQTCHRRFQLWVKHGTLKRVLHALARDLAAAGGFDLTEAFIDATYAGAKKGAVASATPAKARGPRSWQSQTAVVFLSPLLSQVQAPAKSRSLSKPSTRNSSRKRRPG